MKRDSLPREVLDRVDEELLAGEELLWAGRPSGLSSGAMTSPTAKVTALVAVLTAFAVSMGGLMMMRGYPAMWWVLLMIVSLSIIVTASPIYQAIRRNRSTVYAVTDRRALILDGNSVQSYGARDIEFIERRMGRYGRGDILFAREVHPSGAAMWGTGGFSRRAVEMSVGFFGIEDARAVEALMLEVFRPVEVYGGDKPKRDAAEDEDDLSLEAEPEDRQAQRR
ncbi:MAG: hypothetical protein JNM70_16360 [Anaerolineae bacterium]|nr:hypothetical protein [Anaerolineae bacterium]